MSSSNVVFLHPSDELYGADRMLLTMLAAVPSSVTVSVWLPTDLPHPTNALCRELAERGVDVRHTDLPVLRRAYRTPKALARLLARTHRTAGELRRAAPDAVYCTSSAVLLGAASARRAKIPTVLAHVQEIWHRSDALLLTPLASRCDRVLAISDAVARSLPEAVRRKTVVVLNATADPGAPSPLAGRDGPLHFLVASRWNGWKGHRTLLQAWERAGCPGHLTVLGGAPPSGESVDVPALVAGLSRPESVRVVGEVSDPRPYVERCDVMVVPSESPEPFGLVAIEAFAAGRPVIASAAGGLLDIVDDGRDGWLFPLSDAAGLAELLESLTREDVTAAGTAARAAFERVYTLQSYARRWRAALEGLAWSG